LQLQLTIWWLFDFDDGSYGTWGFLCCRHGNIKGEASEKLRLEFDAVASWFVVCASGLAALVFLL